MRVWATGVAQRLEAQPHTVLVASQRQGESITDLIRVKRRTSRGRGALWTTIDIRIAQVCSVHLREVATDEPEPM